MLSVIRLNVVVLLVVAPMKHEKSCTLANYILEREQPYVRPASGDSTVVEHSPHHPKVKGLSPADRARKNTDKNTQLGY